MRTILRKTFTVIAALVVFSLNAAASQQGAAQNPKHESMACCPMAQSSHSGGDKAQGKMGSAKANCPMMQAAASQHSHNDMNARGEKGMGFSQTATQHHFFLTTNGGAIQVEVKDASDQTNLDAIRMHLKHISQAFASGDFDIPMFVHDTTPPGVPEMKQLRDEIHYSYAELPNGGRVVIDSANQAAVDAIHQFLRFQIREHETGDSMDILKTLP
jgi:hypothetical protein